MRIGPKQPSNGNCTNIRSHANKPAFTELCSIVMRVPIEIPEEFRKDADLFPPVLRALLDAELEAGNRIAKVGYTFPAGRMDGACFFMTGPITTRKRASGDGLKFRDYNSSICSGGFTDDGSVFHILEPPVPPEEPDMDAIRAAHLPGAPKQRVFESDPNTALGRFERSMVIDYVKWHDGDGYDMEALNAATPEERNAIQEMLLDRGIEDWRDVEALAAFNTVPAREALQAAMKNADPKIRMAVARHAPHLVPDEQRVSSLVKALETSSIFGGLSQALDEAEDFHPKAVVEALFRGVLKRDGETAVLFAGMLMFVHGKAKAGFDWDQRPFFLRFHTEDRAARKAVFLELCEKIGVEASNYL